MPWHLLAKAFLFTPQFQQGLSMELVYLVPAIPDLQSFLELDQY
jgi:hypothetical protein